MSGLSNVAGDLGSTFGIQAGGKDPIEVSNKPGEGIPASEMRDLPQSSTGRWMFEEAARANGFNPDKVVAGSPEDQQITATLERTLTELQNRPKVHGAASQIEQTRGIIADAVKEPLLDADTAKTLSYAPLAGAFASSQLVKAEASVVATGRAAALSAPEFIAPAAAGTLLGGTLAYTTGAIGEALSTAEPAADVQEDAKASPVTGMETIGERREDDTCAPAGKDGAWVVLNRGSAKPDAIAYQEQISRMPHLPKGVIEYQVTDRVTGRSVDFDGCAFWSPQHELLEAKKIPWARAGAG